MMQRQSRNVPEGTEFVGASNGGTEANGTVTWTFQAARNDKGSVTMTVRVTDEAVTTIENQAFVKVGDHDPVPTGVIKNPLPPEKTETDPGEGMTVRDRI